MTQDLVTAALAEERCLVEQLRNWPAFRRLEALRAVMDRYESDLIARPPRCHRSGSLTSKVVGIAQEYLRHHYKRAQSQEILEAIQARGVKVTGKNPMRVVACLLSQSDLFDNVRGQGYGLKDWSVTDQASSPGR